MAARSISMVAKRQSRVPLTHTTIGDTQARVALVDGEAFLCVADLGRALGYSDLRSYVKTLRALFKRNDLDLDTYLRAVAIIKDGRPMWFITEAGIEALARIVKLKRAKTLQTYIEQGGLRAAATPQPALFPEIAAAAAPAKAARALSLKGYCSKLTDVIVRYVAPEELQEFAEHLDAFTRTITGRRYCPGLNDAAYDLYATAAQLRRA